MRKEQYADWPTLKETADRLGIAQRTIERAIARGEIEQAYRKVPSRRPVVVLKPADVERYAAASVQPQPFVMAPEAVEPNSENGAGAANGHGKALALRTPVSMGALPALLEYLQAAARPAPVTLFLDVKEAAAYSGLPVSTIRTLVADGALAAMKTGRGFRIRRKDLEAL